MTTRFRTHSSPELDPSDNLESPPRNNIVLESESPTVEAAEANAKLLLKLIQDHHEGTKEDDSHKSQRVNGMITIIDDLRGRIQKYQTPPKKVLRRSKTDLRRSDTPPKDKTSRPPADPVTEENQKLRRELSASMTARKSLEKMFSSLGKEKEMIASELSRKVQEVAGMEELVNDLRAENEMLSAKVRTCAAEHKGKKGCGGGGGGEQVALQERNKTLSEHLLKSLDGYKAMKRKLKEAQEERDRVHAKLVEMTEEAKVGMKCVKGLREKGTEEMEEQLCLIERLFAGFYMKLGPLGNK